MSFSRGKTPMAFHGLCMSMCYHDLSCAFMCSPARSDVPGGS